MTIKKQNLCKIVQGSETNEAWNKAMFGRTGEGICQNKNPKWWQKIPVFCRIKGNVGYFGK